MASPLSPLSVLLTAPLSPEDVDFELNKSSLRTLIEFEQKWKQFMKDNPQLIPKGKREQHIENLQAKIKAVRQSQKDVKVELQEQLSFFQRTRDTLEENYAQQMEETKKKQMEINVQLQKHLDNVAIGEHLLSQTIAWDNFLENVDRAVDERSKSGAIPPPEKERTPIENFWNSWSNNTGDKRAKPSARAMVLVDGSVGDANDINLRAYRIDKALLGMQVKMLQKEIEGFEKLAASQEFVGKFLTEHNIWVMLTKKGNATGDSNSCEEKSSLETADTKDGSLASRLGF